MKKLIALAIVAGFLGMAVGCGGDNSGGGVTKVKEGSGAATKMTSGVEKK